MKYLPNSAKQKKVVVTFYFAFCMVVSGIAQRSANWYFGANAAMKFTPSGPVAVSGSNMNTSEGCSTMSDNNGNLLFYTDGQTVWNRNNAVMLNGTGLKGGGSSSQSSIVVPAPGNDNLYYIFTATESGNIYRKYCYNTVDMTLQGGLGEVVQKNIEFDDSCSERITAVQHSNSNDFWIVTNRWRSNTFRAFQLTSSGLSNTPTLTAIGITTNQLAGMCKASPDGNWIIQTVAYSGFDSVQLFRFDATTGMLSGLINLNMQTTNGSYGCCFSPDSKRLYLANWNSNVMNSLFQFTISSRQQLTINNSKSLIPFNTLNYKAIGDLSVGPDGGMYIARNRSTRISCITNPNDSANNLNLLDTAILFSGAMSQLGLPNFYNSINLPPANNIKVDTLSCLKFRFTFNDITNNSNQGIYKWDFGDGSAIDTNSIAFHTYTRTTNDSFLVKFYFRTPDSSINISKQHWLVLPKKPVAAFSAPTNGCISDSVSFINNSTSANGLITQYNWWLGDGSMSSAIGPVKKYADTGTYTIKLLVKDIIGCISDTVKLNVVLNKKTIANFELQGPYCKDLSLLVTDSAKAYNTSISNWWYGWNNGNTYASATNGNFSPTFTTEGILTIKAVVKSPEGCLSDTLIKNYFIYNKPVANFILPKSCVLDNSYFVNTSSVSGASIINYWKWDFGVLNTLSDTSRTANASYQYNTAAQYPVKLCVKTTEGCSDSITQNFTVNGALPKAKLAFINNSVCARDSVVLLNQSNVNFGSITRTEVYWGPFTNIDNSPTYNNLYIYKYQEFGTPANTIQYIKFKVYSGTNCINEIDTFINIKAQPRVQFTLPQSAICGNESPIFLNQGVELNGAQGIFSYSGIGVNYLLNSGYQFLPKLVVPNNSVNIQYTFITPAGCIDSVIQSIQVLPYPVADAGPDRIMLENGQIVLLASATGVGLNYSWAPAQFTNNPNLLQPIVSVNKDTNFILIVRNNLGCTDTDSMKIKVISSIKPPNVFSPNNDGINDKWIIPYLNTYVNCEVIIFNRQGQKVFSSIGYNTSWDGNYNGQPLPAATYYYIINPRNGKPNYTGWVQLLK